MKTVNIKGKGYIPVKERLVYFRDEEAYLAWTIRLKVMNPDTIEKGCLMRCRILDELGQIRAEEWAYEAANSSDVNKMFHVENCSTSVQGRALGQLGIGIFGEEPAGDELPWMTDKKFNDTVTTLRRTVDKAERETVVESLYQFYRVKRYFKTMFSKLVEDAQAKL